MTERNYRVEAVSNNFSISLPGMVVLILNLEQVEQHVLLDE